MWRPIRVTLLSVGLTLALSLPGATDEVDQFVEARRARAGIPGLTLVVMRKGAVVKAQAYGRASLELEAPAATDTVFEIGSLTKQFTAVAVLFLAEDGKLALDDSVSRHLSEAPPSWKPITIRHLLQHTSGLQNFTDTTDFLELARTDYSREEIWKLFTGLALEFSPGESWAYSNTGYYLLGLIVERVSGQPYWEYVSQRLFMPLEMRATRSTDPRAIIPGRAAGYGCGSAAVENRDHLTPSSAYAAGGFVSTVGDLAHWDQALWADSLLPRPLLEQAWRPARLSHDSRLPMPYGFGWFINAYRGGRVVWHSGGTPGFSSFIHHFEKHDLAVILLANCGDVPLDHWALDIAAFFEPALARSQLPAPNLDADTAERLKGALSGLLQETPELPLFTPAFRLSLNTSSGKGLWQWLGSLGRLRSLEVVETEVDGDHSLFRSRAVLGENTYWFTFVVAPNGEIAQILWW